MTLPATHAEPATAPLPEPRIVHAEEVVLSHILRTGVIISIILVVIGTCMSFYRHPDYFSTRYPLQAAKNQPDTKTASRPLGPEEFPHSISGLGSALGQGKGRAFVILGLMVLLATPVISVGSAIIAFGLQRDRKLAMIAATVFLILAISFVFGQSPSPAPPPAKTTIQK